MSFYSSLIKKAEEIASRYNKRLTLVDTDEASFTYRVSAFSEPQCYVITNQPNVKLFYWGLIPFEILPENGTEKAKKEAVAEAEKIRKTMYNIPAENLYKKMVLLNPVNHQRCIIPVTGYYDWHTNNDDFSKIPYYFHPANDDFFSIAGVWEVWQNPVTEQGIHTFAQITTAANPFVRKIHNGGKNAYRMPLILNKEDEEKWLDPELPKEEIQKLLKPFPEKLMDAYPISPDFLKKNKHDPTILDENIKVYD